MQLTTTVAALAAIVPYVSAHGYVSAVTANGKTTTELGPGWFYSQATVGAGWRALNQDNGFVASDAASLASNDISCHKNAKAPAGAIPVAAGTNVGLTWNVWPFDSHKGPIINYLAKCSGSCADEDVASLKFFKISEKGYTNGVWATDDFKTSLTQQVAIPSNIAAGNYVLRHEILALHGGGSAGGAQFYPQCVSIAVTGGGSLAPAGVAGPSLYKTNDPGVLISIYGTISSYKIPGPAVAAGLAKRAAKFFTS